MANRGNLLHLVYDAKRATSEQRDQSAVAQQAPRINVIWGAEAIGAAIGRTERQAKHMMANGQLPARKIQGRWVASVDVLRLFFEGDVK